MIGWFYRVGSDVGIRGKGGGTYSTSKTSNLVFNLSFVVAMSDLEFCLGFTKSLHTIQEISPTQMAERGEKFVIKNEKAKNLGDRVQICYKQPKNLKRIVGQQKGTSKRNKITDVDPGCSKCGKCLLNSCGYQIMELFTK